MKTTSLRRLAEILEAMRALPPDDPRTRALELAAWRLAAEAVGVARRIERAPGVLVKGPT